MRLRALVLAVMALAFGYFGIRFLLIGMQMSAELVDSADMYAVGIASLLASLLIGIAAARIFHGKIVPRWLVATPFVLVAAAAFASMAYSHAA